MAGIPTGTVTFLFTDIEGNTRLAREHPETWETARTRHHAILHDAIELNNGFIFEISIRSPPTCGCSRISMTTCGRLSRGNREVF